MTHRILRPKCEAHYFSLSAGIQIVKTGFQGGCTSCSQNLQGNNPWNVKQKKMKRNKENDFSNILIQNLANQPDLQSPKQNTRAKSESSGLLLLSRRRSRYSPFQFRAYYTIFPSSKRNQRGHATSL